MDSFLINLPYFGSILVAVGLAGCAFWKITGKIEQAARKLSLAVEQKVKENNSDSSPLQNLVAELTIEVDRQKREIEIVKDDVYKHLRKIAQRERRATVEPENGEGATQEQIDEVAALENNGVPKQAEPHALSETEQLNRVKEAIRRKG